MASPQTEAGYTRIANEIVDAMARTRLSGRQSQILWVIFRKTYGYQRKSDKISFSTFTEMTGIDRWHVANELRVLEERRIIAVTRHPKGNVYGFQKNYEQWDKPMSVTENGNTPTDETITENGNDFVTENGNDFVTENGTLKRKKEKKENMPRVTGDFLPSAEEQARLLFAGSRHTNGNQQAEQQLSRAGWDIGNRDLHDAAVYFVAASGIAPPRSKSGRRDWLAALTQHVEEYGPGTLSDLYRLAVSKMRDHKLTVSRPGSLTKILPAIAYERTNPEKGKGYEL